MGIALLTLMGCGSAAEAVPSQTGETIDSSDADTSAGVPVTVSSDIQEVTDGEELLCLVDSKEEAQKIADQYGIELVNFGYGVATFHTDQDPNEVIKMGLEKGYPELSLNGVSKLY